MSDLAGPGHRLGEGEVPRRDPPRCAVRDDRRGQKTGAGFYDYDENRNAVPSPVTEKIIKDFAAKSGANTREIGDQEILERCIYPMIMRREDPRRGQGHPPLGHRCGLGERLRLAVYRGGPMWYGDHVGLDKCWPDEGIPAQMGDAFKPAALLEKLVAEGKRFQDLK